MNTIEKIKNVIEVLDTFSIRNGMMVEYTEEIDTHLIDIYIKYPKGNNLYSSFIYNKVLTDDELLTCFLDKITSYLVAPPINKVRVWPDDQEEFGVSYSLLVPSLKQMLGFDSMDAWNKEALKVDWYKGIVPKY